MLSQQQSSTRVHVGSGRCFCSLQQNNQYNRPINHVYELCDWLSLWTSGAFKRGIRDWSNPDSGPLWLRVAVHDYEPWFVVHSCLNINDITVLMMLRIGCLLWLNYISVSYTIIQFTVLLTEHDEPESMYVELIFSVDPLQYEWLNRTAKFLISKHIVTMKVCGSNGIDEDQPIPHTHVWLCCSLYDRLYLAPPFAKMSDEDRSRRLQSGARLALLLYAINSNFITTMHVSQRNCAINASFKKFWNTWYSTQHSTWSHQ